MFSPIIHRYIFLFGICTMGGGMLLGTVSTSVPQFILLGNWILEGRFKEKFLSLKNNRIFWALAAVYLMHCVGMLRTSDITYGLDDLRIKIPLLLLPLLFFTTKPLNRKELDVLLALFVTGIVISLLWCLYYNFSHVLPDVRKVSRFISHIRLSLFISLGICVLVYFIITKKDFKIRLLSLLVILFFLWFLLRFGFITGLAMFGLLAFVFLTYLIVKQNVRIKILGFSLIAIGILSGTWFVAKEWKANNYISTSKDNVIKSRSLSGRPYFEVKNDWQTENGFYVGYNIQYDELYKEWPRVSNKKIWDRDRKGNPYIWTLMSYMSSKGLTKDSAGLKQLTAEDIKNVENGVTNYKYAHASALRRRIKDFFKEYQDYKYGANPSGNTMLMRLEFWKAAVYIIKRNPVLGVGTGDVPNAFKKAYYRTQTKLSYEWRLRSHNQFLAITVAFGLAGLSVFLFSILYPLIILRKKLHPLYFMFLLIAIVSFLTEDTLESQAGVSFYAYFNTLFLWLGYNPESD